MEYQKTINLTNQPSKFRTRNWVEINEESRATYNKNNQIKSKTSIIMSNLCCCSDACIRVSGTIKITGKVDYDALKQADERKKE